MQIAKKRKYAISIIIILLCIGGWGIRVVALNQQYPAVAVNTYAVEESFQIEDFAIKMHSATMLDPKELEENYALRDSVLQYFSQIEVKVMLVPITITYSGEDIENDVGSLRSLLTRCSLRSNVFSNAMSLELTADLNSDYMETFLETEKVEFLAPFTIPKAQFLESNWIGIDRASFDLVIGCYPVQTAVRVFN